MLGGAHAYFGKSLYISFFVKDLPADVHKWWQHVFVLAGVPPKAKGLRRQAENCGSFFSRDVIAILWQAHKNTL